MSSGTPVTSLSIRIVIINNNTSTRWYFVDYEKRKKPNNIQVNMLIRAISLPCVYICLRHRTLRMTVADGRPPCPWCFRHRHRRRNGFGAVGDCCWDSASPVARAVAVVAACWGPWSGTSWPPAQCDPQNRPQTSTTAPVAHARAGDPMSEPFFLLWGARYKSARTHARARSRSQTIAPPRDDNMFVCVCVRAWECECAEVWVHGTCDETRALHRLVPGVRKTKYDVAMEW